MRIDGLGPRPVTDESMVRLVVPIAVALVVATLLLLVMMQVGHGNTDLRGAFAVFDTQPGALEDGDACIQSPTYADIGTGTPVRVLDANADLLATGELGVGRFNGSSCEYPFLVTGVPESGIYTIEVGDRGGVTYTDDELDATNWDIDVEIGR